MNPVVDLHTHVLPGVDDGPESEAESLALLSVMAGAGTEVVVATSHHKPPVFVLDNVQERCDRLSEAAEAAGIQITILPGAEIALYPEIIEDLEQDRLTLLGRGRACLLEMPSHPLPPRFRDFVFAVASRGIKPVLAHPERCASITSRPELLGGFRESGALVQVTAGALLGEQGRGERRFVRSIIERGWVDIVASDAHGRYGRTCDLLSAQAVARKWCGSQEQAEAMIRSTPWNLVSGAD